MENTQKVDDKEYTITGPFADYPCPFGKVIHSLVSNKWFVSRQLTESERTTEFQKITGETCLGVITKLVAPKDGMRKTFVINNLYPIVEFETLEECVVYLAKNEKKLVFLT